MSLLRSAMGIKNAYVKCPPVKSCASAFLSNQRADGAIAISGLDIKSGVSGLCPCLYFWSLQLNSLKYGDRSN